MRSWQTGPLTRKCLDHLRRDTNPRKLRTEIYHLIDQLHRLPYAAEGVSEDVYQTLFLLPNTIKGESIPVTLSNDRTIYVG